MKTQRFIVTVFTLLFVFASPLFHDAIADTKARGQRYSATLISPKAGDVLVPGQVVRVEWTTALPNIQPNLCETELRLSLDGGNTFTWMTGERDPTVTHFDWVVPATPTNQAVIDIHFGCLGYYPETASIQRQAMFTISNVWN
jgi:hypothetical protein